MVWSFHHNIFPYTQIFLFYFYCLKCSEALSNLENACWACNVAISNSKPVKPYKREEEKVIIEEKINKKGKKKQDNKL